MKKFVFALVLFAVLIGCGIWYQYALTDFAHEISEHCDEIEQLVYAGDMAALEEKFEAFEAYWKKKETNLAYFVDHAHLNSMTTAFGALGMAIRAQSEVDILMANARIDSEARDVAEDELLRPENVF